MPEGFDPYRKWLGIPPAEQPPNHYRLLGIGPFEDDPDVIESAADQRMSHLRTFQAGAHSALSQKLLNEVAAAKLCLLSAAAKATYDAQLRRQLDAAEGERPLPKARALTESRDAGHSAAVAADSYSPVLIVAREDTRSRKPMTRRQARQPAVVWLAASAVGAILLGVAGYAVFRPTARSVRATSPTAVTARPEKPDRQTAPQREKPAGNIAENSSPEAAPITSRGSDPGGPPRAVAPFDARQARAHQEAWAAHLSVPVEQTNSIGVRLVLIPPGEFTMGSTLEQIAEAKDSMYQPNDPQWHFDRLDAELPAHRVTITRPFLIGAMEVTIGQYLRFVDATSYVTEADRLGGGSSTSKEETDPQKKSHAWHSPEYPVSDDSAVSQVTWADAVAFCNWLSESERKSPCYRRDVNGEFVPAPEGDGYRLPTEAEWEYACRAGTMTQFSFGDDRSELAQHAWSSRSGEVLQPHAVGAKKPNAFGLSDMHGNVEEWCQDWFGVDYYAQSPPADPTGPAQGQSRMMRGGSRDAPWLTFRSAFRRDYPPFWRFNDLGFRVVRVMPGLVGD